MWRRIKNSLAINVLLVFVTVAVLISVSRMARDALTLRTEALAGQERIAALRARKAALETRLAELQTPEILEREAKEKLNLKNRGEIVVIVATSAPAAPAAGERSRSGGVSGFFAGMLARAAALLGGR